MPTLDELHDQLTVAASLLDAATVAIRECSLAPTREHFRRIGDALAKVYEIQHAIYEVRPDLKPGVLREPSEFAAANGRLTVALSTAYKCGETGQYNEAARLLAEFIAAEPSDRHRAIAQMVLDRNTANDGS